MKSLLKLIIGLLKWIVGLFLLLSGLITFWIGGVGSNAAGGSVILLAMFVIPPLSRLTETITKGRINQSNRWWIATILVFPTLFFIVRYQREEEAAARANGFATSAEWDEARHLGIRDPKQLEAYKSEQAKREQLATLEREKQQAEKRIAAEKAQLETAKLIEAEAKKVEEEKRLAIEKEDHSAHAFIQCKDFVTRSLKAPSTADFPFIDYSAFRQKDQIYVIKSYVDSQNSFGAQIRSNWHCRVQFVGGDWADILSWRLLDLEIS